MFKIIEEDGLEKFLNRNKKHLSELVKLENEYLLLDDLANPFVEEDVLKEVRAALKALAVIYKEMLELLQKIQRLKKQLQIAEKKKNPALKQTLKSLKDDCWLVEKSGVVKLDELRVVKTMRTNPKILGR